MDKPIKPCPICAGACRVSGGGKKFAVICTRCGNESPTKSTRPAAINSHNHSGFRLHKQLL